ncbi:MAG: hypothetical protein WA982_10630 [Rubrobacteraceae bacterium]
MNEQPAGPAGDSPGLHRLAERLIAGRRLLDPTEEKPRLLVERMPEELQDIPVPEGFAVVGSIAGVRDITGSEEVEVVLDAPVNMDEAVDAYREVLRPSGWEESDLPTRSMHGGFSHGAPRRWVLFCKSPRGPSLTVTAQQMPEQIAQELGALTDVRLDYSGESRRSRCSQSRYELRELEPVVPTLNHPVGAKPLEYGMSGRS